MRFLEVQVTAVDGASADHTFDAFAFHFAQGLNVGHVGKAARGDDGNGERLRELDGGVDVDAAEHAITADVGVDDAFNTVVFKLLAQVDHIVAGELAPAVGGHLAVARVQPHDDVAAKRGAGVLQEAGILDRGGTDDDVTQAGVEVALNRVEVADTAAELYVHFAANFLQDLANGHLVLGMSGKRAVQVHQMQTPCTLVHPAAGHDVGLLAERGGLVHVALFEAYAVAVFEVNRRN